MAWRSAWRTGIGPGWGYRAVAGLPTWVGPGGARHLTISDQLTTHDQRTIGRRLTMRGRPYSPLDPQPGLA